MSDRTSLETTLGPLLMRAALAPLAVVAAVAAADPDVRGIWLYVGILVLPTALLSLGLGRRLGRRLERRPTGRLKETRETSSNGSDVEASRTRADGLDRTAYALARRRSERSVRAGEVVRELAHSSLLIHDRARALGDQLDDSEHAPSADVEAIAAAAARVQRTVARLLPEIRCPQAPDSDATTDVAQAATLAIEQMQPRIRRLEIAVLLTAPPRPLRCPGDVLSLHAVFVQLLENALDAVVAGRRQPGGQIAAERISVAISATPEDLAILVEMTDCGVGLPTLDPTLLFRPDYTTKGVGRGAGLALCRHRLTRVGGVIELQARGDQRGARVRLALPQATE